MGNDKVKGQKGPGQKHLHSRISYLYQAAAYLANIESENEKVLQSVIEKERLGTSHMDRGQQEHDVEQGKPGFEYDLRKADTQVDREPGLVSAQQLPLSRLFINHLKAVSLKGQVRLTPEMKRSLCRRCDILLRPGSTSISTLENKSRGGKKPCADVLALTCVSCGSVKRFPIGAMRQPKRADRARKKDRSSD